MGLTNVNSDIQPHACVIDLEIYYYIEDFTGINNVNEVISN